MALEINFDNEVGKRAEASGIRLTAEEFQAAGHMDYEVKTLRLALEMAMERLDVLEVRLRRYRSERQ